MSARELPKVGRDGVVTLRGEVIGRVRRSFDGRSWGASYKGGLLGIADTRAGAVDLLREQDRRRHLSAEAHDLSTRLRTAGADSWARGYAYGLCRTIQFESVDPRAAAELLYEAAQTVHLVSVIRREREADRKAVPQ